MNVILRQVTRDYQLGQTTVTALHQVDFRISQGDFITVAGPSGSGKTTLLNMLGVLDTPTSGTVEMDGQNVGTLDLTARAQLRNLKIGFIFQSFNLVPVLSVYENIELPTLIGKKPKGRKETQDWIMYLISAVGLQDRVKHKPDELSGGQRQRVAIARAFVNKPELILADEPTANLDSATAMNILDLMRQLNREENTAFAFSTHDPEIIERCHRVVRMKDGRIVSEDAPVRSKLTDFRPTLLAV